MDNVTIRYDPVGNVGIYTTDNVNSTSWNRITAAAINLDPNSLASNIIRLSWYQALTILRDFIPLQRQLSFKFATDSSSKPLVDRFLEEQKKTREAQTQNLLTPSSEEINTSLEEIGFTKRVLKWFQSRDVCTLVSLPHGANFSVPGAGKTTVALAVHFIVASNLKLLVICPKAAFLAWNDIIQECLDSDGGTQSNFLNLSSLTEGEIQSRYTSDQEFFYTNYEHFVSRRDLFAFLIATNPTHLVLDESHRMKAGLLSQRGSALLSIANLPVRKDILSGTPMPQGSSDLQSQLDFLYPGSTLGRRLLQGETPNTVISGLFVRTTKNELGLPPVSRHFVQVAMSAPQATLYAVVKSEVLRQLSSFRNHSTSNILSARKSVIRLLQIATNPYHILRELSQEGDYNAHGILTALSEEPISNKVREACRIARENASLGKKTVIWSIFTKNILDLERIIADLNPVSIYGAIRTGEDDDQETREGRLAKFHNDESCYVLIANPAAAGEGISLHTVCHDAVYLDRSYVSTHYLQSIDRIHRLGLQPGTVTNITILQSTTPSGIGSIDYSVSRRLLRKIRDLEQLLDDPDLRQVALDEESALQPIDFSLTIDDIVDLIEELEGRHPFNESEMI